jgi:hypothetical protein
MVRDLQREMGERAAVQGGVAFIEMVLVLPLLLAILAFVIDGSRLIQEHVALDAFAREIARSGAGLPELEAGTFDSNDALPPVTALLYQRAESLFLIGNTHRGISSNLYFLKTVNDGSKLEVSLSVDCSFLLGLQTKLWNWGSANPARISVVAQIPRLS